jgi:Suppressor of fused protein (SUFU)
VSGGFRAEREAIYGRIFGDVLEVIPGDTNESPRIDVHVYGPGHAAREFYTLVTSGMSDRAMKPPPEVGREGRRAELALYVDQPGKTFVELLRFVARLPFAHEAWLGHGHSIPNGEPPRPLFRGSELTGLLVLRSNVAPEASMQEVVAIDGDPVSMLMVLPVTATELDLKVREGAEALLEVFNTKQLSFVVDTGRPSVV